MAGRAIKLLEDGGSSSSTDRGWRGTSRRCRASISCRSRAGAADPCDRHPL